MQEYIIKGFRRTSDGAILERQDTGTNSGSYQVRGETTCKRLNDFLCDGGYTIHSVLRCERVENQNPAGTVFTVGDALSNNIHEFTGRGFIRTIKIELSDVVLTVGPALNQTFGRIRLVNAQKYVEPVAARTTTIKKGPGRPKTNPFEAIELSIAQQYTRPIRLERTLKKSVARLNVEQFIVKLLTEWNNERATIYVDDRTVQTSIKRRRSLGDIYMICKYYYPSVTLKEVATLLYVTLHTTLRGRGFRTSKCGQILKRVWYVAAGSGDSVASQEQEDEYGHTWAWWIERLR